MRRSLEAESLLGMSAKSRTLEELERLTTSDGWARALALSLVRDVSQADDVLQDAYVVALEGDKPPIGSFSNWLAGVIRNVARARNRADWSRPHRERQGSVAETVPSPEESSARLEQQGILIQHLLELSAPLREALIMRHVDGLAPRHIAKRLGLPVATVNSRLARGLEQLRLRLDAENEGQRERWMSAFAPLLVLPHHSKSLALGGILVNNKILLAAAITLSLIFGGSLIDWSLESGPVMGDPIAGGSSLSAVGAVEESELAVQDNQERALVDVQEPPSTEAEAALEPLVGLILRDVNTREALPRTRVWVVTMDELYNGLKDPAALRRRLPWSFRERIKERGRAYVADDEGRVSIALGDDRALVFAEHEELRMMDDLRQGAEETTLLLGPDRPFSVRVLDSRGRPLAGTPVVLAGRASRGGSETFLVPVATAETAGAEGLAELLLTQQGSKISEQMDLVVAVALPLAKEISALLNPFNLPSTPIELQLPELGEVQVRVLRGGEPVADGLLVRLAPTNERGTADTLYGESTLYGSTEDGLARLGSVGLGSKLIAGVLLPDSADLEIVEFEGPVRAGQLVEVDLVLRRVPTRLTGRVVEAASGEPVTDVLSMERDGQLPGSLGLDEEGRFDLVIGLLPEELQLRLLRYGGPGGPDTLEVTLPVSRGEHLDLGELHLVAAEPPAPPPGPAVTGRVVDPQGAAVSSATLRWVVLHEESGAWVPAGGPYAHTSRDGSFRLLGELPHPEACIEVSSSMGWIDPLRAAVPSHDLILELNAGASLEGRLALDEGMDGGSLSIGLWDSRQGEAPERMDVWGWRHGEVKGAQFRFPGMRPGVYTFRVEPDGHANSMIASPGGDSDSAIVVQGIELREDPTRDPRLDPLDMRGLLRSIRLHAADEQGARLSATVYAIRDGRPHYVGHTGRTEFVVSADAPDAYVVECDGYFPVALDPRDLPDSVTLERGMAVPFVWEGPCSLEEVPFRLELTLVPVERTEVVGGASVAYYMGRFSPRSSYLDAEEPPRVLEEGLYELRLASSVEEPANVFWGGPLELDGIETVQVAEGMAPISITISQEAIDAEDARLRAGMKR